MALVRSYVSTGFGTSRTISVDTSGGDLLIAYTVGAYTEGSTNLPSGITFNAGAMTLHGTQFAATTSPGLSLYKLGTGLGGTANVVASWANNGYVILIVEVWSGTAGDLRTAQTGSASTGTNATVTYTNGQTGDTIVAVGGLHKALGGAATLTTDGSQTEVQNATTGTGTLHATGATSYEAGSASVVMNYTASASSRWAVLAAAIIPAAGGSTTRRDGITKGLHRGLAA